VEDFQSGTRGASSPQAVEAAHRTLVPDDLDAAMPMEEDGDAVTTSNESPVQHVSSPVTVTLDEMDVDSSAKAAANALSSLVTGASPRSSALAAVFSHKRTRKVTAEAEEKVEPKVQLTRTKQRKSKKPKHSAPEAPTAADGDDENEDDDVQAADAAVAPLVTLPAMAGIPVHLLRLGVEAWRRYRDRQAAPMQRACDDAMADCMFQLADHIPEGALLQVPEWKQTRRGESRKVSAAPK
jgi:hypothetical protein